MNTIGNAAPYNRSREGSVRVGSFDTKVRSRIVVLAVIIGLHVALVIYITMFRPAPIKPPEVPQVLMTNLIAEPTVTKPAPLTPAPLPVTKPVTKPVAKPVAKPMQVPTPEPAIKPRIETPPVTDAKANVPIAAAEPSPSAPSPALPLPPAAPGQAVAVTPPRFNAAYLNNPPPNYPVMARRLGEEGRVMLRVFVTPEGTAGEVRIQSSSGSPLFDEAAMEAVRQWRFVPARQGENAVAAWVQVPIVFRLT